ncbi:MAG: hypothetical protein GY795_41880 [Desulfobacterales bacterium]|nr:hypothetical protein [Desulfobacterales bacterium]
MKKVGSLKYGVLFKKAFCDPEIFKAFVKDFLNIDLKTDYIETEKSFTPSVGKVDVKFDLFAEDRENRVIVDIQHVRHPDHYHRFLYYHCVALIESIASSENYKPGLEVYTLVVLTSGDRHKKDIGIIDFDPSDLKGNKFGEIPHKIIYICPKYVNDETPESYREWMLAINDSLDEEVDESRYNRPEIHKVFGLIEKDMISPKEYAAMKDEYNRQLLIEEGIEKVEKAALNLLKLGTMPDEQIAQIMSMTLEEIQKLKKGIK